ncbi:MAG: molybdopterin-dependent oxidoreductase, partial [Acidobacteria bacterium]|nr:molybdopterin-dependent oxidoreductase [Acidobacteriota bacterium]
MRIFDAVPKQVEEELSRRGFLQLAGMFVVSVASTQAQNAGPYPDPNYRQLDSWIVIHEDSTATFYVGKTDLGQGTGTAFRQMMADELDVAF